MANIALVLRCITDSADLQTDSMLNPADASGEEAAAPASLLELAGRVGLVPTEVAALLRRGERAESLRPYRWRQLRAIADYRARFRLRRQGRL